MIFMLYILVLLYYVVNGYVIFGVANHKKLTDQQKVFWTYFIFFLPVVGMSIYYLVQYRRRFRRLDPSFQ